VREYRGILHFRRSGIGSSDVNSASSPMTGESYQTGESYHLVPPPLIGSLAPLAHVWSPVCVLCLGLVGRTPIGATKIIPFGYGELRQSSLGSCPLT
jgi:hypothetical protein